MTTPIPVAVAACSAAIAINFASVSVRVCFVKSMFLRNPNLGLSLRNYTTRKCLVKERGLWGDVQGVENPSAAESLRCSLHHRSGERGVARAGNSKHGSSDANRSDDFRRPGREQARQYSASLLLVPRH